MVARAFRAALFAGLVLAFWTLARPAQAATFAPFCDDRGATALASPPTLEATDEAVRRAALPACETDAPLLGLSLGPAHRVVQAASGEATPARTAAPTPIAPAPSQPLGLAFPVALPQSGVRFRVERPPRG